MQEIPVKQLGFLGTIRGADEKPAGSCFQVGDGFLITASHVLAAIGAEEIGRLVHFSPIGSDEVFTATVERLDQAHDLALLRAITSPLKDVALLSYSDQQSAGTSFQIVGFATLREGYVSVQHRYLPTIGEWEGCASTADGTLLARGRADGVERGMSGSPIIRITDGAVIGVLSQRYNSADGWSQGRIWISRIEDLKPLLVDLVEVPCVEIPPISSDKALWLTETPIDREALLLDKCFVKPDKWASQWETAAQSVSDGDILVISASPGVGATTFAEQVLAQELPKDILPIRLDPGDWDKPTAKSLPLKTRRAYILDLRDPEHDTPSSEFINDLNVLAQWFKGARTRLVITIAEQLWRGKSKHSHSNLRVISLNDGVDSLILIRSYIAVQAPELLPVLKMQEVEPHLEGMNAVQAQYALQDIVSIAASRDEKESVEDLGKRIGSRLDDHREKLDVIFGEENSDIPPHHYTEKDGTTLRRLSFEDRCLLVALACEKSVRFAQLERDSERLIAALQNKKPSELPGAPDQAFAGPGLRGRINGIGASISPSEIVSLKRPGFAEGIVRYVWDNYTKVRRPLVRWLLDLAADSTIRENLAAEWISDLVRRHQDVDFIRQDLAKLAAERAQHELLANVLYAATLDTHMRRRCERLLYDWADKPEMHFVVIKVSSRLLESDRRVIALRRLRRVADAHGSTVKSHTEILDSFSSAMRSAGLRDWFLNSMTEWIRAGTSATSTKLAFTAIIDADVNGIPWLLTREADEENIVRMLGSLLGDAASIESAANALVALVERASADDDLYNRLMDYLASAAEAHGAIAALFGLGARFSEVGRKVGRDPLSDTSRRVKIVRVAPPDEDSSTDS
ncbi:trypsin-like peptidase domain-containing protein [Nonomuraea sp. KC401]|uniref:S1 family peptidase n=1 Tax=unclassified Nonomuraea TaxID=2593643 RepID=UPI0010FD5C59|nr:MULTISPECIES: serine protease [unclassified Nonomuraea]NBE99987.1 hypothetical protein [Nonomuraea sp. K271]TLF54484.1 trypsin-like peptidase domain-containing protein [Nonomuraea sp. KC401]